MTDQDLLDRSLDRLQATGAIEYTGEYGAEITTFIPFAFWLKTQGLLSGRRVVTYRGMRPYYYFLDDDEFHEKSDLREWRPIEQRDWPNNSTYSATRQAWHVLPDYRARYESQGRTFQRPVLFIQNKFTVEWGRGPINYLPLTLLKTLFSYSSDRFDVVYSRPGIVSGGPGYTSDRNMHCDYPDLALARSFENVLILEDFCALSGASYNLTKLEVLAKSRIFVAVQGGGAHLMACFGGSVLLLLHVQGDEYPYTYKSGAYTYLSSPAPLLLLARNYEQLATGVDLIGSLQTTSNGVELDTGFMPVLQSLRV